jgi:hypothetical protein
MLITKIIDEDIDSCYKVFECDMQLKTIENEFYSLLSKCSADLEFDMERNVNEYMARVARLAYLQGIIDFSKLFVVLKEDAHDILAKYVDK